MTGETGIAMDIPTGGKLYPTQKQKPRRGVFYFCKQGSDELKEKIE
jgi:hypothetical protein